MKTVSNLTIWGKLHVKGISLSKKLRRATLIALAIIIVFVFYIIINSPSILFNYYTKYGTYHINELSGPFPIQINLNNPEHNVGKVLCQNNGCEIYVESVEDRSYVGYNPGYEVTFCSTYQCNWNGVQQLATFVPDGGYGLRYIPVFYWDGSEKMNCKIAGYSGDIDSVSIFIPYEEDSSSTFPDVITIEFPYVCLRTWT